MTEYGFSVPVGMVYPRMEVTIRLNGVDRRVHLINKFASRSTPPEPGDYVGFRSVGDPQSKPSERGIVRRVVSDRRGTIFEIEPRA